MAERNTTQNSSPATDGGNPRVVLRDLALHAGQFKDIVSSLSSAILDGQERKDHILEAVERASQPPLAETKIPIPADTLEPSPIPRTTIGMIGSTGVGKSTLLSSVLGREILPTSSLKRGTAAPTIITYHPHDHIDAALTFMPLNEVRDFLEGAVDLLEPDENGRLLSNEDLKDDPSYAFVTEAFDLKKANLIRIKKESKDASAEDPKSAVNVILRLYPELIGMLGTTINISEQTEGDFRKALESCIGAAGTSKGLKKWMFLTGAVIKCNAEVLSAGSVLVDCPGFGDCSTAVLRAIQKIKAGLDVKLVAVLPQRASSEAIVSEHMTEEIQRRKQLGIPIEKQLGTVASDPSDPERRIGATYATSSGLAIVMTKCDVRASLGDRMESTEKEINGLEEDEDIGEVLERNAAYGNLIARCDDAKRALLRPLDKKERELTHAPGTLSLGSSAQSPRHRTQHMAAKRAKLQVPDDGNQMDTAAGSGDDAEEHGGFSNAAAEKQDEDEREERRLQKLYMQLLSQRRTLAFNARYLVSGANVRRRFGERMNDAMQDVDDVDDGGDMMSEDYEDYSLPVFATSAEDFGRAQGDKAVECQAGVPAFREFLRHLGSRVECQAALDLLRPFRAEVRSTHTLLMATDDETIGVEVAQQKRELRRRWSSRDDSVQMKLEPPLGSSPSHIPGIRQRLEVAFARKIKERLKHARAQLKVVEAACEEGATAAAIGAQAKALSLVSEKGHWGPHRAALRHRGHYEVKRRGRYEERREDYNIALANPLILAINEAMDRYCCGCGLLGKLRTGLASAAKVIFDEVKAFRGISDGGIHRDLDSCSSTSLQDLKDRIQQGRYF